jgi:hydroxymethylglutaryl-CoA synthase
MPNGKFPLRAGKILGFTPEQLQEGWLVNIMGNTYSGSSPTGLTAILDAAKPGDQILLVSFGSGAGSDAFVIRATDRLPGIQDKAPGVRAILDQNKHYLDYGQYARYRRKIIFNSPI